VAKSFITSNCERGRKKYDLREGKMRRKIKKGRKKRRN